MNQKQILKFIDDAKNNLSNDKFLRPIFFLEKRDDTLNIISPDYSSDDNKNESLRKISNMLKSGQYKSFLHIVEAWTVKKTNIKEDEIKDIDFSKITRPSLDPKRTEAIMSIYKNDLGDGNMSCIPFIRNNKGDIIFEEEILNNIEQVKIGGNFWEIWN